MKLRTRITSAVFAVIALLAGVQAFADPTATAPASQPAADIFARGNLVAWCIVPYDGQHRNPQQRAEMLERIGLRKFAYDWRAQHLPGFDSELDELQKHKIELVGVWFPDALNNDARFMLDCLAKHHVHTQLWVASWGSDGLAQQARVDEVADRMRPIAKAAGQIGCTLGLYNHGGWFGEPENQLAIVDRLNHDGITNVGIVYNLHHGYGDLDRFPQLFPKMLPHLLAVNLNGMSKIPPGIGEPVVPVGQGALDLALLKIIRDSGYAGPIGIINESNEDAEARLLDNIAGLDWLRPQLNRQPAGIRPQPKTWRPPG
jgi:sugar phosphate isomerase/epimerase